MVNDPIADFIIRIKNSYQAHKQKVNSPYSTIREELAKILKGEHYIKDYSVNTVRIGTFDKKEIVVSLYYRKGEPAISQVVRVSKPGSRIYVASDAIPYVQTGYGIAIISTSKGVLTDRAARTKKVGGELLCKIW